mgnify:CR=1 FL=1
MKVTSKQIQIALTKWAEKTFPGAYGTKIEKNKFGNWQVTVDHDDGYFIEEYTFAVVGGKLCSIGLTTSEY